MERKVAFRLFLSLSLLLSVPPSDLWRDRLIGMAPRWKRGGPKGLCGFESRSLRFLISNLKSEILISNLKFGVWDLNIRLRTPCNHELVNPARTGR